jgi:hypothetical protein
VSLVGACDVQPLQFRTHEIRVADLFIGLGLLANEEAFFDFLSGPLPADQWMREVTLWFQTGLSKMQELIMANIDSSILGNPNSHLVIQSVKEANISESEREAAERQCGNQMINTRGQVQNFHFVGLIITIVVSMLIILVGLFVEPCMKLKRLLRPSSVGRARSAAWETDSMYYVLRVALEGIGARGWRRGGKGQGCDIWVIDPDTRLQPPVLGDNAVDGFYRASIELEEMQEDGE